MNKQDLSWVVAKAKCLGEIQILKDEKRYIDPFFPSRGSHGIRKLSWGGGTTLHRGHCPRPLWLQMVRDHLVSEGTRWSHKQKGPVVGPTVGKKAPLGNLLCKNFQRSAMPPTVPRHQNRKITTTNGGLNPNYYLIARSCVFLPLFSTVTFLQQQCSDMLF